MNYTLKDANKILVGDTLTLEDGSVHEAVKDKDIVSCAQCSISQNGFWCRNRKLAFGCTKYDFHFIKIKL